MRGGAGHWRHLLLSWFDVGKLSRGVHDIGVLVGAELATYAHKPPRTCDGPNLRCRELQAAECAIPAPRRWRGATENVEAARVPRRELILRFAKHGAFDIHRLANGYDLPAFIRLGGGDEGGNVRLRATARGCPTDSAVDIVKGWADAAQGDPRQQGLALLQLLAAKRSILQRMRRDVSLKARMDLSVIVHVPFAIGALMAVVVHVFVVFYYR